MLISPTSESREEGVPSDPRTRLAVLPHFPWWGLWSGVLSVVVLTLGLSAKWVPGFSTGEFGVDQELSRHHEGFLTLVAMTINSVFAPAGGVVIIALVGLYLLVVRRAPVNAVAFMAVTAAGWLSSEVFKAIVARHRPDPALLFDPLSPETGSTSFPSGHTALAVGLAFALFFLARHTRWSAVVAVAGTAIAVMVAWSRVYVGVHYPTDVLASFLCSAAAVILFTGLWNRYATHVLPRIPLLARFGPVPASPSLPKE